MSFPDDRLYASLPALLRLRDAAQGEPLRALLRVLSEQGRVVDEDLARLYDNLFIETCDDWVVPYLGDLLGVRGVNDLGATGFSQRARVANTLAYRRRKGTATMLEQLALDTTGWRARVVEFFELVSTTQWLNHLRPRALHTPDLRKTEALEWVDGAFDTATHSADVRRIASGRGRHNLHQVGLFLWRLQSYTLGGVTARPAPDGGVAARRGRFYVNPLGLSSPLFNRPQTETDLSHLATEINVPGALRRRPLYDELEALRQAAVDGTTRPTPWFGANPVFSVAYRLTPGGALTPVEPVEMLVCNLEDPATPLTTLWPRPPVKKSYVRQSDGQAVDRPIQVAVDPVLGRVAFPAGVVPAEVVVTSAYGFSGDVGGGPYDRRESVTRFPLTEVSWQVGVSKAFEGATDATLHATFASAVAAWNAQPAGTTGVIVLVDSATYPFAPLTIDVRRGSRLLVVSAGWPESPVAGGAEGEPRRLPGQLAPAGVRAHLLGDLRVTGGEGAQLWLDGVLTEGALEIAANAGSGLARLQVTHCTVVTPGAAWRVTGAQPELEVALARSLTGPLDFGENVRTLQIDESAVDGLGGAALLARRTALEINASTVVGTVAGKELQAGNSLFTDLLTIERKQTGCVRFSYVPPGSQTPRRHRCQPDLALAAATTPEEEARVLSRVVPDFTDEGYGRPAWLQLARTSPEEIRTGADHGAEMGVWHFLRQPQREANLRVGLDEYLRLGLEAGLIYVT